MVDPKHRRPPILVFRSSGIDR